jgi:hypothetical protein
MMPMALSPQLRPAPPAEAPDGARRLSGEPRARSARPALEGLQRI